MADASGLSVIELQQRIEAGQLTSRELIAHGLRRMELLEPVLNAVLEINPRALATAEALDVERNRRGAARGPLHGVPVLLKDNIETAAPLPTTAGSRALAGNVALRDAFLVQRLRSAGAIVLGKTNLSEWANFRSANSISGWSGVGGQTRNAYDPLRSPGGSSSGSAVAVAAGYCPLAVGTETDGSIVSPAAMNSIVGIKPTVGLVSRGGVVPLAHSQDTAGPMARSVADAALLLEVLAGSDGDDADSAPADSHHTAYSGALDAYPLRRARLGFCRNFSGAHEKLDAVIATALQTLRAAGATLVDVETVAAEAVRPRERVVMLHEFKAGLDRYLPQRREGPRSLADIIAFNREHAAESMPLFGQDLLLAAQQTRGLADNRYRQARDDIRHLTRDCIDGLLRRERLDALLAPTIGLPWLIDGINGDYRPFSSAYLAAVAGYPAITVPAGYGHGLPVGLSLLGGAWQEAKLIGLAHDFERLSRVRRPPPDPAARPET